MRGDLFGPGTGDERRLPAALVNPRLLRVELDGELLARQGSMVAYQGAIEFVYEGSGGLKRMLKKFATGEGVPLMRCRGTGDLYLAHGGFELHLVDLDDESLTVSGRNVLAFDSALDWDIRRIEGTITSGDVFNMVLTGTGTVALAACGTPIVLDTSVGPTFADIHSAIAWSSALTTKIVRTAGAAAVVGRGSGEAFQLAFDGDGFVVVQASEGPVIPPHKHRGDFLDLLG
jgi:uncharacterized protein (AIM24 family)